MKKVLVGFLLSALLFCTSFADTSRKEELGLYKKIIITKAEIDKYYGAGYNSAIEKVFTNIRMNKNTKKLDEIENRLEKMVKNYQGKKHLNYYEYRESVLVLNMYYRTKFLKDYIFKKYTPINSSNSSSSNNNSIITGNNKKNNNSYNNSSYNNNTITYENKDKGYKISYANKKNLKKIYDPNSDIAIFNSNTGGNILFGTTDISKNYKSSNEIADIIKENLRIEYNISQNEIKKENTIINGISGFKISLLFKGAKFEQYLLFSGADNLYIITKGVPQDKFDNELDEILNSFTITKKSNVYKILNKKDNLVSISYDYILPNSWERYKISDNYIYIYNKNKDEKITFITRALKKNETLNDAYTNTRDFLSKKNNVRNIRYSETSLDNKKAYFIDYTLDGKERRFYITSYNGMILTITVEYNSFLSSDIEKVLNSIKINK